MVADRIASFLAREPVTLSDLEGALGLSLGRDRTTDEAWLVRRRDPASELSFLYAAFVGHDLRGDASPELEEVRLFTTGADLRALATDLLGPATRRGGDVTSGPPSFQPVTSPVTFEWMRRGALLVHDDATRLFWTRAEVPFATARSADEEAALIAGLAALLQGPLEVSRLAHHFGALSMSGRHGRRLQRAPTWQLAAEPLEGSRASSVAFTLSPPLPVEPLLAGLGLGPMIVATLGTHQSSARVVDASTLRSPVSNGHRIDIRVPHAERGEPSSVSVPAQRAYAIRNMSCDAIHIDDAG